jgi:Mycoplasma protein of unknown function, DUF285
MTEMFGGANAFVGIGLNKWNSEHVEKMSGMCAGAFVFNTNLSLWNVGNVKDLSYMFARKIKAWMM